VSRHISLLFRFHFTIVSRINFEIIMHGDLRCCKRPQLFRESEPVPLSKRILYLSCSCAFKFVYAWGNTRLYRPRENTCVTITQRKRAKLTSKYQRQVSDTQFNANESKTHALVNHEMYGHSSGKGKSRRRLSKNGNLRISMRN